MSQNRTVEEQIQLLDIKLQQLRREYDQYFLGTRPREPVLLAGEVRKLISQLTNNPITNTGLKFKFSSLCSRYQAFNRQWQENLRQIDQGTYQRHRFRADLHSRERPAAADPVSPSAVEAGRDVFAAYVEARRACGQDVENLSREKLDAVLEKQAESLRERFGADSDIRFRVVVEDGRAKLKAGRGG